MKTLRTIATAVAALTAMSFACTAFADVPPAWAVGDYRGVSPKYHLREDLHIGRRGGVHIAIWKRGGGGQDHRTGTWMGRHLQLGKDKYHVERTDDGLRLIKESDRSDVTIFHRQ